MQSTTTTKEHTMKTQFTHKLVQLSLLLGSAATLAASAGYTRASDETLKREIEPLQGALAKLRTLS